MGDKSLAQQADITLWCGAGTTEGLPVERSCSSRPSAPLAESCMQHRSSRTADASAAGEHVRSGASASSQYAAEGQKKDMPRKAADANGAADRCVCSPMAYRREKWLDLLLKGFLLPLALAAIGWFASKYINPSAICSSAPAQAQALAQIQPLVGLCNLAQWECTGSAQNAAKNASLCSDEICAWLQNVDTCGFSAEQVQGCQKGTSSAPALSPLHKPAGGVFHERGAGLSNNSSSNIPSPATLNRAPPAASVAHPTPAPSLAFSIAPAPAGMAPPVTYTDSTAMLISLICSLATAGVIVALIWWRYRLRVKACRATSRFNDGSNDGMHGNPVSTMCMV